VVEIPIMRVQIMPNWWMRLKMKGSGFLLTCLLVVGVLSLSIEKARSDEQALRVRMAEINLDVERTEAFLESLKAEFGKLKGEKTLIDSRLENLRAEEGALNRRITAIESERSALILRVEDAEANVLQRKDTMRRRIVSMYKQSSMTSVPILLRVSAGTDRTSNLYFARHVRAHDRRRFKTLQEALEELNQARLVLDRSYSDEQAQREQLIANLSEAERERARLSRTVEVMRRKQNAAKASLVSLQGKARLLDTLLGNLLDRSSSLGDSGSKKGDKTLETSIEQRLGGKRRERHRVFDDPQGGLFESGAVLFKPAEGTVVRPFGRKRVRNFSDIVFSKGVEFEVQKGSDIKAVKSGRVAFVGEMPGYNKVVIVDHGHRTHSLYGKLSAFTVAVGDLVPGGGIVGNTSTSDQKPQRFYFEVRKNGKSVNPGRLNIF
jgi:septal ring factor EnvC (AmiA/AmiB activator)